MIGLHFHIQEEHIIELSSCGYNLVSKRKILFNILMPSVKCLHFKSTSRPLCNIGP